MSQTESWFNPAVLLKGGAVVYFFIGAGITAWIIDKAINQPEIQASQFGFEAPLWIPSALFVVVSMVAGVALLWRAAQRVEAGENLFKQRHRRSAREKTTANEQTPTEKQTPPSEQTSASQDTSQ